MSQPLKRLPHLRARAAASFIADDADATRDEPLPRWLGGHQANRSVPVAVRLAPKDALAIEARAASSTYRCHLCCVVGYLQRSPASAEESVSAAIDRIAADVQRLRELIV